MLGLERVEMNQETKERIKELVNELQSLIGNEESSDDSYCEDDWPYDSDGVPQFVIDRINSIESVCPPDTSFLLYESHLEAIFDQWEKKAFLLKDGYRFDKKHGICDVTPYEFDGEGYAGSVPVVFTVNKDQLSLQEIRVENITGDIYGVVVHSSSGRLIAYLPLKGVAVDGGDYILTGAGRLKND